MDYEFLISKYSFDVNFNPNLLFNYDIILDKDFILEKSSDSFISDFIKSHEIPNLSNCFILDSYDNFSQKKKSSPDGRNLTKIIWRKQSESSETRSIVNFNFNFVVVKEIEFKISEKNISEFRINEGLNFSIISDINKFTQVMKLMKCYDGININKQKIKNRFVSKLFAQFNEQFKIKPDNPIWFIDCTQMFESKQELLLGPFSSNQLLNLYELKNINEYTELKLASEIIQFGEIPKLGSFKLKNLTKILNL